MFIIVGKATPNRQTGDIELYLREFRQMLQHQGQFVYAWSFNPDARAIFTIQQHLDNNEDVFLYLPFDGQHSNLRMHIINFVHNHNGIDRCPVAWTPCCVGGLQGQQDWGVHIWFLINAIDDLQEPIDLLATFTPAFSDKYHVWGRNFFAFLQG
ncbi:MAG TPA: hypothetical protein PK018_09225 [Candidatus Competibacter sp.]|nr:hypothetical protein [Candidatus Competibacteraceae bacterium]HPE72335.1 hypothetical protein [Candidatus Competibacter sp.]HRW66500.1 hypothetical protein [Candidatus Competibacter sp.]